MLDRAKLKTLGFAGLGLFALGFALVGLLLLWSILNLPKLDNMQDYRPALQSVVLARDGRVLGEYVDDERRYLVSIEEIPEHVVQAFLAAEDEHFFTHSGVDVIGLIRATLANLRAGGVVQGGSTITMQVAKGLLLSSERTFGRKLRELLLAQKIEKNFAKKQILYLYLNHVYFGQRAYGVEAASRSYFHKHIKEVSVAEAAILASLVKAPSSFAPLRDPVRCRERQLYVLRRMKDTGKIDDEKYKLSIAEDIKVYPEENLSSVAAPYYVEHVRQIVMDKYKQDALYKGGLTIETAADYDLSVTAMKAVKANLEELDKRQGYRGPVDHVATEAKMVELLREIRGEVINKRFGFQVMPLKPEEFDKTRWNDYTYARMQSMEPSLSDERKLLLPWERYRAVVTSMDPDGKAATVMVGTIKGKISINNMRWAKRVKPPETSNYAQIAKVQEALKTGDVILVKPVLPLPEASAEPVAFTLEQVPVAQSALLSMEAATGYVVAMVGGYDFNVSKFNRALQGERQPGSAFKPMLYSAALDKGFTPSSIIVDSPIIFDNQGAQGLKWIPENNSEKFYGDTTLRTAVINSRNVPAVKLLQEIGLPYFVKYLKNIGLEGELSPDLSLALGSKGMSLQEITKIYALFPRLGVRIEPVFINKVTDRDGNKLEEYSFKEYERQLSAKWLEKKQLQAAEEKPATEEQASDPATSTGKEPVVVSPPKTDQPPTFDDPLRALDSRTAFVMGHLLQEVVLYGTGTGARVLKRKIGGKTGTTSEFVDAWFMGFSPELVTGVWTGFDTPHSLGKGEVGSRAALPAWIDYMAAALERYKVDDYVVPKGIVFSRIDSKTGSLAGPGDSAGVKEAYIEGTEPTRERQNQQAPDSSDFFREDM
ncbi:MAG TPA: PBP1A family penicillin-binding protein [Bdellovibrionota bacterium]